MDLSGEPVLHLLHRCYTHAAMPSRWPEVRSRRELLLRLVEQGREVLDRERGETAVRRREAIRRTSGALTGVYEPGYLERLRDDWPA